MKDVLDKIRSYNAPATDEAVSNLQTFLEKDNSLPSIAVLESTLAYYKAAERALRTKDLLDWMNEHDQTTFANEEVKVTIKTSISSKMMDSTIGFKWLEEHQYGDMIKDTMEFPKGELTAEAEKAIDDLGLSYTKKSGIHPQTLKKILSDRLKDGEDLPEWSEDDPGDGIKVGYFDECVVKEL